eukprot:Hpha_TRINITY_DN16575_c3_g1::TRINITY_DN16575_c3_g1_i1::g.135802::m.135802
MLSFRPTSPRLSNKCCGGCCSCRWLVRPGDTPDEARIKTRMFPFALIVFVYCVIAILAVANTSKQQLYIVGCGIIAVGLAIFMLGAVGNFIPAGHLLDAVLVLLTIGLIALDLCDTARSYPFHSWTYVVLILDMALVFKRGHMAYFIITVVLLYKAALQVESVQRLGLYEVGYWGSEGEKISHCNCASPPCGSNAIDAADGLVSVCIVFLGDFYFTRGFASGMRLQLRRVEAAVEVAAEVTGALTRYDVDAAEKAIETDQHLPQELMESYRCLVSNLRRYRAYLPHSCLVHDSSSGEGEKSLDEDESDLAEKSLDGEDSEPREVAHSPAGVGVLVQVESTLSSPVEESPRRLVSGLKVKPRRMNVSLAAGNKIGYLRGARFTSRDHIAWMANDVQWWCAEVAAAKGVVDNFAGDRRYASFNARRPCSAHVSAAVGVLSSRGEGEWTGCVVSGHAVCGNYGHTTAMRFMVLGGLTCSLHSFERVAALWRTKVLVDGTAFALACQRWKGVLLGAVFVSKRGGLALEVYSITTPKNNTLHSFSGGPEEWMSEEGDEHNTRVGRLISAKLSEVRERPYLWNEDGERWRAAGMVWSLSEVGLTAM